MDTLSVVRFRLASLVAARTVEPLTATDKLEYEVLGRLEKSLLARPTGD